MVSISKMTNITRGSWTSFHSTQHSTEAIFSEWHENYVFLFVPVSLSVWHSPRYRAGEMRCSQSNILHTVAYSCLYNPELRCTAPFAGESELSPSGKSLTTHVNWRQTHFTQCNLLQMNSLVNIRNTCVRPRTSALLSVEVFWSSNRPVMLGHHLLITLLLCILLVLCVCLCVCAFQTW